jgi:5-methylcytosine-specific restriction endonuclease McrA
MRAYDTKAYRTARARLRHLPCSYCGTPGPSQIDHIKPLTKGGTNSITNLVRACQPCNLKRRDMKHSRKKRRRRERSPNW